MPSAVGIACACPAEPCYAHFWSPTPPGGRHEVTTIDFGRMYHWGISADCPICNIGDAMSADGLGPLGGSGLGRREPEDSLMMETGHDMGGKHVEAAAAIFPQHEKEEDCPTFGCGFRKNHLGGHSHGTTKQLTDNQRVKNQRYAEAKVAEIGYPGVNITSFAANNAKGTHTCDFCGNPYNPVLPHDCFKTAEPEPLPIGEIRVGAIDDVVAGVLRIEVENIPNEQARRVLIDVLPGLIELYLKKSKDYGGDVGAMIGLGPKAHFVDMWRKMGKLKRALWDGVELEGEKPEEIMRDLVGHIFIILDTITRE